MKKIVINISDVAYEKFMFEALHEKKNISKVIRDRIFSKPFDPDVEKAFENWLQDQILSIMNED
jgi:hypothetical protein